MLFLGRERISYIALICRLGQMHQLIYLMIRQVMIRASGTVQTYSIRVQGITSMLLVPMIPGSVLIINLILTAVFIVMGL